MFLIELTYQLPWEEVQKYVVEHRAFLGRYYEARELLVSGPKANKTGGIILSLQTNRAAVDELIHHDPFYVKGVAKYTVSEFAAVKFQPEIQELLGN